LNFSRILFHPHCTQFRSWTWGAFAIKPLNGKWSWTIWDTDRSYGDIGWNGFYEYAYTNAEKWPNIIPQKLILNKKFQAGLINRNCDLLNSLMVPEIAISIYDSLVNILEPEMDAEYERWKPGNRYRWDINNEGVREFLRKRPATLYNQMKSYFGISDTVRINIHIIGNGRVKLNSLFIDEELWSGIYMDSISISLEALPDAGTNFIEWKGIGKDHSIVIDPAEVTNIIAVFDTAAGNERENLVINEIMYNPLYSGSSEWIELFNPNDISVSLDGFTFSDGIEGNVFEFPPATIIDPQEYLLLAGDYNLLLTEYGQINSVEGSFNKGLFGFKLSNEGETIFLRNSNGIIEDQVRFSNLLPWPTEADGTGPSLQLSSAELENYSYENWFADAEGLYTPGLENVDKDLNVKLAEGFEYNVYPNPLGEELHVDIPQDFKSNIELEIYTLTGQLAASEQLPTQPGSNRITWNHGIHHDGMYLLRISIFRNDGLMTRTKLIVIDR